MTSINREPQDCSACKLIGGVGLIGSGIYVGYFANNNKSWRKHTMLGISAGMFKNILCAELNLFRILCSVNLLYIFPIIYFPE